MNNSKVLVSISVTTYNHSKFIRNCLDGILMQKTNFSFEVLLRDDASNDGTKEVCREYEAKYPTKIKLLAYSENQWQKGVRPFMDNVKRAKGKYIAICEGDDYWTDPLKLQKQVDFLEKNQEYSIHSGCAERVDRINQKAKFTQNRFDFKDFLTSNHLITCTVLFRNNIIDYSVLNKKNIFYGDMYLYLCILFKSRGFAYISNDVLSHYRVHSEGFMKSNTTMQHNYNRAIQFWCTKKYLGIPFSDYTKNDFKKINKIYVRVIIDLIVVKRKIEGFKIMYRLLMLVRYYFPLKEMFKVFLKKVLKIK